MNYSFLEAAKEELEEAVRYYEEQREGLGSEFAQRDYHHDHKNPGIPRCLGQDFKECSMLQDQAIPLWNYLYGARRGDPDIGGDAPSSKARILEKTLMKRAGLSNRKRLRQEIVGSCREMADVYLAVEREYHPREEEVHRALSASPKARRSQASSKKKSH